eukprot:1731174-Pleurochrysis_carterae.AAC.3
MALTMFATSVSVRRGRPGREYVVRRSESPSVSRSTASAGPERTEKAEGMKATRMSVADARAARVAAAAA